MSEWVSVSSVPDGYYWLWLRLPPVDDGSSIGSLAHVVPGIYRVNADTGVGEFLVIHADGPARPPSRNPTHWMTMPKPSGVVPMKSRNEFIAALNMVNTAYPDATVELTNNGARIKSGRRVLGIGSGVVGAWRNAAELLGMNYGQG